MIGRVGLCYSLSFLWILAGCVGTVPSTGSPDRSAELPTESGAVIAEQSPPRDRARIHTELAGAYYERGNMAVALEELRVAIAADPSYAPAYNVLGLVHSDLREYDQAQANFERSLRISPTDPDANHNYGWFLCRTDREELSLRYFLAAIRNPLYSTPQKSYLLAANCAVRKNKDTEALEYYEKSLRLDPNYLGAIMGMAQLRYKRGELAESQLLIGRYTKLVDATAESLWLALRIERRLGDKAAENNLALQLRRQFPGSPEYQGLIKGQFN